MSLSTRILAATACEDRIQHAFALALARGIAPRSVVVILLDADHSIWATHRAFKDLNRASVVVEGRAYAVCCAVLDRTELIAWWGAVYPASCEALLSRPDQRNTFVVGFDDPAGATLISAPIRGANDTRSDRA